MEYKEFETCLVAELQNFYGKNVVITAERVQGNNGQYYEGLQIAMKATDRIIPIINMDEIYEEYRMGSMDIKECAQEVCRIRKKNECTEDIIQFAERLTDWEFVKDTVYPVLLSTEENRELLQKLVSMPLLDLSVVYIIREKMPKGNEGCLKVNKAMLDVYGIDRKKMHEQAMENMKGDGYSFQDMDCLINDMLRSMGWKGESFPWEEMEKRKMYVLTNTSKKYGAAGILDMEMIKRFAGNRDYFILPSSIHETIFVPADNGFDSKELEKMVKEINETAVAKEERLSDHCYYYDAKAEEIRIFA